MDENSKLNDETFCSFFVILFVDVKIPQFVRSFGHRHHTEKVAQLLLLQIFLAQILEVTLGKWCLRVDGNGRLVPRDNNGLSQISGFVSHLDAILEKFLKIGWRKDGIIRWRLTIDAEFQLLF